MGWWWSSSDASSANDELKPQQELSQPATSASTSLYAPASTTNATKPPQSREEAAFEELRDLFTSINPEAASRATETIQNPPPPVSEEHAESLYPVTMSCSQAFDLAYYCASMGGQLNNVYRFGGLRSCSEQWKAWRFCMRTKAMSEEEKKRQIREFHMEREAKKRVGRNSERIWEIRTEPVKEAFSKRIEDVERETSESATGA